MSDTASLLPPPVFPRAFLSAAEAAAPVEATGAGWWAVLRDGAAAELHSFDPRGLLVGEIVPAPPGTRLLDRWNGGRFSRPTPPVPSPSRVITAPEFLALFTADEAAALWIADSSLMFGAMQVLAQGSANLDSPDLGNLLGLAVAKGVLTEARARRIASGQTPAPTAEASAATP